MRRVTSPGILGQGFLQGGESVHTTIYVSAGSFCLFVCFSTFSCSFFLPKRRIPLAVVLPRPCRGAGTLIPSAQRFVWEW